MSQMEQSACEDLKAFERRLTEVIAALHPPTLRWRIILFVISTLTALGAWYWLTDPRTSVVPLTESLLNHPIFTVGIVILDDDLNAIRAQRLAEMQKQYGGSEQKQQGEAQEERRRQEEDMKNSILAQILDQAARARLNTLKLSKPEKAQMVEQMIIRMAQMGQIPGKLDDAQLVQLLESVNRQMPRSTSAVKFDRRRAALDSDDEDYGL
uniref:Uncharacterized protein n=1 Tax=Phlebotomus papatasi TaxID=29031 RepID=A0A1B0DC28_PHLPP